MPTGKVAYLGTWLLSNIRGRRLTALLAGALLPLAFAPFAISLTAVIAPMVLLALWRSCTRREAFVIGLLFGLGLFGLGTNWIYVSVHTFGGVPLVPALFLTGLFIFVVALFFGGLGYLFIRLRQGDSIVSRLLLFPALWLLIEWLRGWLFTGFPWLALGYSQIDAPLGSLAPILGVYGVSLFTVFTSALLYQAFVTNGRRRGAWVAGVVMLWGVAALMGQVSWTQPQGEPFRASLIQGNFSQDEKWEPGTLETAMARYRALTREYWDSDLIIWPESAIPLFYHQVPTKYLDDLLVEARANNTDILIGMLHMNLATRDYYNGVMKLDTVPRFFYKRHLVPFTEYLPLKDLFGGIVDFMDFPMSDFKKGSDDQPLLKAAGYPLGSGICYEDAFGEEMIDALPEAAYLVNVSNDAWFGTSIAPHQHLQMARMRAKEMGRYLLRATNTGVTAIIDEHGKVIAQEPQFEVAVVTADVTPYQGATPYVRVGNWAVVLLALGMVLIGRFSGSRRK